MKNTFKEQKMSPGAQKNTSKSPDLHKHPEIKADSPLIEKDEVKQAEERMRRHRML